MASAWSVALCTYNGEKYLPEQLESIASQTLLPREIVIHDDGSTDGTVEIAREFARSIPAQVRIHVNDVNQGSAVNFEAAIKRCTGSFIALSDQDDVWHPLKLERLERTFAQFPDAGVVFSDGWLIDSASESIEGSLWERIGFCGADIGFVNSSRSYQFLARRSVVTGAALAVRREFVDIVVPIPRGWVHDRWIALLLSVVAEVVALPERLIGYRLHSEQQIGVGKGRLQKPTQIEQQWLDHLEQIGALIDRVRHSKYAWGREVAEALTVLESRLEHFRVRAMLPQHRVHRVPFIFSELRRGRYAAFSNGLCSACRDIIRRVEDGHLDKVL